MKTKNEFYLKKIENERALLELEYKIKQQINSLTRAKGILSNLVSLPFQLGANKQTSSSKTNAGETSDNLLKNSIQLFQSIKETIMLSKNIFNQIKS